MKLEEILKSQGWADADITALQPMLADPRIRASMEETYGKIASERDTLKNKDAEWQRLHDEEWQPVVNRLEKSMTGVRLELAQAQERIKLAKEFGYLDDQKTAEADAAAAKAKLESNLNGFDPKKYVSMEDAQKMLEAEGRAITMAADLNNEYAYLHGGKTLYDYEAEVNGQRLRGLEALRQESRTKRVSLDQYVSQKFDFSGKRAALQAQRQKEQEDAIRKDEGERVRKELAEQYGNPNMRTAVPSRAPFMAPATDGKQVWDIPAQERKNRRVDQALKVQMGGQPN